MRIGLVIGTVVAPVKHPFYEGKKILVVQPEDPYGEKETRPVVAVDLAQAGVGDRVLIIEEGSSSRDLCEAPDAPVHSTIVGVIDYIEVEGRQTYPPGDET